MLFGIWRAATSLAAPLVRRYLDERRRTGREHPERWPERLGIDPSVRPDGPLVWIHAASVGESVSILPLLDRLQSLRPDLTLLLTTGTVTAATLMAERLPKGVLHRFAPVDLPKAVDRFLDRWRPDLALVVESELWPNLFAALERRGIALVVVNGRLGKSAFARWSWAKPIARRVLRPVRLVLAQTPEDARRYQALGAREVACPGNLKHAAAPLPVDEQRLDELRAVLGPRPVWLAASTHAGEEAVVARVHLALATAIPDLITIVIPRQPRRGAEIQTSLTGTGLVVVQRSAGSALPDHGIYLADTLGELGLFYRLCPVVFVGGSLVRHGGQNPLEPARLGCAVLFGPHVWNFTDIADGLIRSGAACEVVDDTALAEAVARLLADPVEATAMGEAAAAFARDQAGVLQHILEALVPLLPARR